MRIISKINTSDDYLPVETYWKKYLDYASRPSYQIEDWGFIVNSNKYSCKSYKIII